MINITEVRITLREGDDNEKLRAFANITIDGCFVIRGLKVIRGGEREDRELFVAMPSRKKKDGTFQDIAHPINRETREYLEDLVIGAYLETIGAAPLPPRHLRASLSPREAVMGAEAALRDNREAEEAAENHDPREAGPSYRLGDPRGHGRSDTERPGEPRRSGGGGYRG